MQAHTFLEIIEVRWGFWAHMLFGFYAFMTNFIVSIMMVMGAVVVTNTLTGVNAYGEAFPSWKYTLPMKAKMLHPGL